ncbi:MAG: efflux RND transporter permease subunit [Rhodospirillales bacterium]
MIAKVIELSIGQRLVVLVLAVAVAALGIQSLTRLPIDAVPDITNNQVQISAVAPSLAPVEMEKRVTFPIELALAGIPGLESTRSISRNGFAQVTAVFSDRTDIFFARQQVTERLIGAKETLPDGVEPRLGPISTGLGEVVMWIVDYDRRAPAAAGIPGPQPDGSFLTPGGERLRTTLERAAYLRTVQDWMIRPQMKGVPGVAGVDSIGGYEKVYQVQPHLGRLAAHGVALVELAEAIERNNTAIGAGFVERNGEALVVRADGRLATMDDIGDVVVAAYGGVPLRVRDLAEVSIGQTPRTGAASAGGEEVVVGTALMLIGANSRTVAAAVTERLQAVQAGLPPGIVATPVLDRTRLVDATVRTVEKNLAEGALLVIAVLFLFLGNLRAALIAALVIPVTMLMTATGMLKAGISANLMSLGALDFGLIVDGAVIVTENCLRRLALRQHQVGRLLTAGERRRTVAAATSEMIQPTVFGQAIIIIVYLPMLSFSGVEGKMFEPMALTVMTALACAFVLSLTLVPAMIAMFVRGPVRERKGRAMERTEARYAALVRRAVARPPAVAAAAAVLVAGCLALLSQLGQEFVPTLDEQDIAMHAMRIPSTSLEQSARMQARVERAVAKLPEVAVVFSKTGTAEVATDPMPPNVSDTFIVLKPRADWPDPGKPKPALVAEIEAAVAAVPGNNYEFTQPIQMRFNELIAGVRADLAVKVHGADMAAMLATANRVAAALRGVDGATDVKVEQVAGLPYLDIRLDRQAIARHGLSVAAVQDVIAAAVGGRQAGVVFEGDRPVDIVLRLDEGARNDLSVLQDLQVPVGRGDGGRPVTLPLRALASVAIDEGPNQISRENGRRRVVVQANVRGRDLGSVVADAQARIAATVTLAPGQSLTWGGQYENLLAAEARLRLVVPACFAAIFFLLFMALGSLRDAAIVFTGVPLALCGGIVALALRGMPVSVTAIVGFIALSGIAVLNGLVVVTRIQQGMAAGLDRSAAVADAAVVRLRPVLITALVAALGFVPMAVATGTGAEVQRPIATVVIGGLVSATALTLFVLPALYAWFGAGRRATEDDAPAVPAAAE